MCLRAARRGVATSPGPLAPRRICTCVKTQPWEHVSPRQSLPLGPSVNTCLGHSTLLLGLPSTPSECCVHFLSSKQIEAKSERGGRKARLGMTWKTTKDSTQRHGQCTVAVNLSPLDPVYLHPSGLPTGAPVPPNTPSSSELKKPGFER